MEQFSLKQKYNRNAFIENVLEGKLFAYGDFEKNIQESVDFGFKGKYIQQVSVLGYVEKHGKTIILEIIHNGINDPRSSITREATKVLEKLGRRNALIIFIGENLDKYRFSLLITSFTEEGKETTNPKRCSYLLGIGEKVVTPSRFLNVSNEYNIGYIRSFDDLERRFNVEVVRDEFYDDYMSLFVRLYKDIINNFEFHNLLLGQNIDVVKFSKNFLGKIIFLYFVQKKGWFKLKESGKQEKDFLRAIWQDFEANGGLFYNKYLEKLFYNGLNERDSVFRENFKWTVPYLNGGLFKKDYKFDENINFTKISNSTFSSNNIKEPGIIDVFDLYNFTTDENDINEKEIAVDPEMLGNIFEKMISVDSNNISIIVENFDKYGKVKTDNDLNKKLGAFYTPKEIVNYMCKESLIKYLLNNVNNPKITDVIIRNIFNFKEPTYFQDKKQLIYRYDNLSENEKKETIETVEVVDRLLKSVKIIDPAIGSGAFPVGIMKEIVEIRYFFREYKFIKDNKNVYDLKKETIKDCIYGVDIDSGAIDIARLRFWLSLIIDENKSEVDPLPNFEFKFVCANSLMPLGEKFCQLQVGDTEVEKISLELKNLSKDWFNADSQDKKLLIETKYLSELKTISSLKTEAAEIIESYKPFDKENCAKFFNSDFMFGIEKFDIIIGNPPYNADLSENEKKIFKNIYKSVKTGRIDTAGLFIEYAKNLSLIGGIIYYIIPYRLFSRKRNHGELQLFILSSLSINEVIYLGSNVDFNANDEFMICGFENKISIDHNIKIQIKPNLSEIGINYRSASQLTYLNNGEINLNSVLYNQDLISKIQYNSIFLSDICESRDGIVPFIRDKMVSNLRKDNRYVKFAGVAGTYKLDKYSFNSEEQYLCYDINEAKKYISDINELRKVQLRDKEIFLHDKIITSQNNSTLKGTIDYDGYFVSNSIHSTYLKEEYKNKYDLKYILSLINSKLINYYHNSLRTKGTDLHPQILVGNLRKLPIKNINKNTQAIISKIVDKIVDTKKLNHNYNTIRLESLLDIIIYKIYELSLNNVKFIDPDLKMNLDEYVLFQVEEKFINNEINKIQEAESLETSKKYGTFDIIYQTREDWKALKKVVINHISDLSGHNLPIPSDGLLIKICDAKPHNKEELLNIHGFNQTYFEFIGEEFLVNLNK